VAKQPEDCDTMLEVREGVDDIDRQLVRLLVTRQGYMHAAARIKPNRAAVYDADRIEDIIEKVLVQAKIFGLSGYIAEPVWRKLIERCIAHEFEVYDETRAKTA